MKHLIKLVCDKIFQMDTQFHCSHRNHRVNYESDCIMDREIEEFVVYLEYSMVNTLPLTGYITHRVSDWDKKKAMPRPNTQIEITFECEKVQF